MKISFLLTLMLIATNFVLGQNCYCPMKSNFIQTDNQQPDSIFTLFNGEKLALCGYSEIDNEEKVWSEFTISWCGADTALLEFDATQNCAIEQWEDTLVIEEYYNIANGRNMSLQWTKFYVIKLYWDNNRWTTKSYYRQDLQKYSKTEIEHVLYEYDTTKTIQGFDGDKILLIGYRLFWAYVSGSKEAGQDLEQLEHKFGGDDGFDSAVKEDYDALMMTYGSYLKE